MATGTAWGSASTAGIALIAIAHQLNIDAGMAAGAIIAEQYSEINYHRYQIQQT